MTLARALAAVSGVLFVLAVAGCPAREYRMTDPPSFKRFHGEEGLRMITADGVMLKVREVENYEAPSLAREASSGALRRREGPSLARGASLEAPRSDTPSDLHRRISRLRS